MDLFFAFLTVTLLLSASPGPAMLNCMADAARYGIKKSLLTMLGISLGNLLLILLSALGVAFLLQRFPSMLVWIQYLGGIYLIYLGIELWRLPPKSDVQTKHKNQLLMKGFLIATTNPKGIIYFSAFFPQFITPSETWYWQYAFLGILVLLIDFIWMCIYGLFGKQLTLWLAAPESQKRLNQIIGSFLILAGIGLSLIH